MRGSILALLIFSMAGCGDIIAPDTVSLSFEGTVTAQATGQPVAGAEIHLADPVILFDVRARTTSDAQGHYSLAHSLKPCIDGDFGITLSASGSGFDTKVVQVACNASLQRIDFSLAPAPAP